MSEVVIPSNTLLGVYTGEARIVENQELPSPGGYEESNYVLDFPIMQTPMTPGNVNVNPTTRS